MHNRNQRKKSAWSYPQDHVSILRVGSALSVLDRGPIPRTVAAMSPLLPALGKSSHAQVIRLGAKSYQRFFSPDLCLQSDSNQRSHNFTLPALSRQAPTFPLSYHRGHVRKNLELNDKVPESQTSQSCKEKCDQTLKGIELRTLQSRVHPSDHSATLPPC